jgi:hypothetical protein
MQIKLVLMVDRSKCSKSPAAAGSFNPQSDDSCDEQRTALNGTFLYVYSESNLFTSFNPTVKHFTNPLNKSLTIANLVIVHLISGFGQGISDHFHPQNASSLLFSYDRSGSVAAFPFYALRPSHETSHRSASNSQISPKISAFDGWPQY